MQTSKLAYFKLSAILHAGKPGLWLAANSNQVSLLVRRKKV
jgi:hypothetical protein